MVLTNTNQKKTIKILAAIITSIVLSTIASQSTFASSISDVGFQDGLSDCRSGTSDAINGHSNAGHHSAEYMKAYNDGLGSCNPNTKLLNNGNNNQNTGTDNSNQNNRIQAQSQGANQHYSCFVLIGACGAQTNAQGQSLNN